MQFNRRHFHTTVELFALKLSNTYAVFERGSWHSRGLSNSIDNIWVCVHQSEMSLNTWYLFIVSIKLRWWWTGSFWRNKIEKNVMDKIWDRKSFEVGGHWPLWWGWKTRLTTQNRQKSNPNFFLNQTPIMVNELLSCNMLSVRCLVKQNIKYIGQPFSTYDDMIRYNKTSYRCLRDKLASELWKTARRLVVSKSSMKHATSRCIKPIITVTTDRPLVKQLLAWKWHYMTTPCPPYSPQIVIICV